MNRVPWVLALLLAGGTAATVAVMAADAPDAQPQIAWFVCQFIAFTPKDPAALVDHAAPAKPIRVHGHSITPGPDFGFPRWMLLQKAVRAPDGEWLLKSLGELAPQFGPLDALKGRDPKAIEELLTRLDDRWNYYIETLSGSAPLGHMPASVGRVGPIPLRTAGGTAIGPADNEVFVVGCVVRVDRVVGGGRAVAQRASFTTSRGEGIGVSGDSTSERPLGAPCFEEGASSDIRPYRSAAGVDYPDVVWPGLIRLLTVDLVQPETPQRPGHN